MSILNTIPQPSRWSRIRDSKIGYSFRKNPVAVASMCIFVVIVIMAILAPLIAPFDPYDPAQIDIMNSEYPPVWIDGADPQFLLGTDDQGRDLWSTILYGTRLSLMIGLCAVTLQAVLGISIGLISGYVGGRLDSLLMRMADIQLSFSTLWCGTFCQTHCRRSLSFQPCRWQTRSFQKPRCPSWAWACHPASRRLGL